MEGKITYIVIVFIHRSMVALSWLYSSELDSFFSHQHSHTLAHTEMQENWFQQFQVFETFYHAHSTGIHSDGLL